MRFNRIALSALALAAAVLPAGAAEAWRATGFASPESVAYDAANQRLIVSNLGDDSTTAEGNGTLSLVGLDGAVQDVDWVSGLDSPKGSAIAGNSLYVADVTNLRIVDLTSGAVETVAVTGAVFLNDVAIGDDGTVYLSDTFGNAILTYKDGAVATLVQDEALGAPNGLLVDGDSLLVVSLGTMMQNPESPEPGGLTRVDLATGALTKDTTVGDFGALDGIVKAGEDFYVTDFTGTVFKLAPGAAPAPFATLVMGSADLGTDGTDLFVPLMMDGAVAKITTAE